MQLLRVVSGIQDDTSERQLGVSSQCCSQDWYNMDVVAFVGWGEQTDYRDATDRHGRVSSVPDRIFVFMVRSSKSNALIGEKPVALFIFLAFGGGDGRKKCRVTDEDDVVVEHPWKVLQWWNQQAGLISLSHEELMNTGESIRSQSLAKGMERVVGGNVGGTDSYGGSIDRICGQFFTELSIRKYPFLDLQNTRENQGSGVANGADQCCENTSGIASLAACICVPFFEPPVQYWCSIFQEYTKGTLQATTKEKAMNYEISWCIRAGENVGLLSLFWAEIFGLLFALLHRETALKCSMGRDFGLLSKIAAHNTLLSI